MPPMKKLNKMNDGGCLYGISGFFEALHKVGKFAIKWDDDIFDRLSHRYTVVLLVVFVIILSTKQYVGDPISCWCPATFTEPMMEYTNNMCWISNTYYLPMNVVPNKHNIKRSEVIGYYQWIPLVMLLQALMFYIPSLIWSVCNSQSGLDINKLVLLISGIEHINPDIRDKTIKFMCRHFDRALAYHREYRKGKLHRCLQAMSKHCFCPIGKLYGNYLTSVYLFVKFLYIINAAGQLYIMNQFLLDEGNEFYLYGIRVLKRIIDNKQPDTKFFPRVTLCDFKIRHMQNVHDYTVQCALPINLYNEKIYIYLWFHFCFVAIVSFFGLVMLLSHLFSYTSQTYITKYLKIMCKVKQEAGALEVRMIRSFVDDYLRSDGVFTIRIIAKNTNDVISAEIIGALFEYYKKSNVYRSEVARDMSFVKLAAIPEV